MKSDAEYIKSFNNCPDCGSGKIHAVGNVRNEGNVATQRIECDGCGLQYADLYELVGFMNLSHD